VPDDEADPMIASGLAIAMGDSTCAAAGCVSSSFEVPFSAESVAVVFTSLACLSRGFESSGFGLSSSGLGLLSSGFDFVSSLTSVSGKSLCSGFRSAGRGGGCVGRRRGSGGGI